MAISDFTGNNIQDTYQRVVQTDGTNLADGTGSLLPISFDGNNVTISGSLTANEYIVSSSVTNITIATLSGSTEFGDTTDDTHTFIGNITASGNINASGNLIVNEITASGDVLLENILFSSTNTIKRTNNGSILTFGSSNMVMSAGGVQSISLTGTSININESGADLDFRVEGDTDQHLFFINAGANKVAIGTDTISDSLLTVDGDITIASGITASGDISSSGKITADKIRAGGYAGSSVFDIAAGSGGIDTDGPVSCTVISNSSTYTGGGRVVLSGASSYIETPSYVSASRIITTNLTASDNISSSGEVYAQQYFIENRSILDYSTSGELLRLGYNNDTKTIKVGRNSVTTNGILLDANVTASGNISASGDLTVNNINGIINGGTF